MPGTVLVPLPFSTIPFVPLLEELGRLPEDQEMKIIVALRPRQLLKAIKNADKTKLPTKEDIKSLKNADPEDIDMVVDYLTQQGFTIIDTSIFMRHVRATGTVAQIAQAFGVVLNWYEVMDDKSFGHDGPILVPRSWDGRVEEIFGLNNFPLLSEQFHDYLEEQSETDPYNYPPVDDCDPPKHFTIDDLKKIYRFPEASRGEGQTIAMISLDGGFYQEDLEAYWRGIGLSPPGTPGAECWPEVEVFGENNPSPPDQLKRYLEELYDGKQLSGTNAEINQNSWTLEITMDIELMGAMANAAKLQVYFIGSADILSFYNLLSDIKKGKPDVVSGSFSVPERTTPKPTLNAVNLAFENCANHGIDFCFAAGNYGAYPTTIKGEKILTPGFPSSCQYVTGCGGVLMRWRDRKLARPVFNQLYSGKYPMASGGGISTNFKAMPWQKEALPHFENRVCPDFCFTTDLETSPMILVGGVAFMSGGTSAATVYWAALKARLRSALGNKRPANEPLGPMLWSAEARSTISCCIQGNSCIPPSDEGKYQAEPGYALCTGWGWPDGEALLAALNEYLDKQDEEVKAEKA